MVASMHPSNCNTTYQWKMVCLFTCSCVCVCVSVSQSDCNMTLPMRGCIHLRVCIDWPLARLVDLQVWVRKRIFLVKLAVVPPAISCQDGGLVVYVASNFHPFSCSQSLSLHPLLRYDIMCHVCDISLPLSRLSMLGFSKRTTSMLHPSFLIKRHPGFVN